MQKKNLAKQSNEASGKKAVNKPKGLEQEFSDEEAAIDPRQLQAILRRVRLYEILREVHGLK